MFLLRSVSRLTVCLMLMVACSVSFLALADSASNSDPDKKAFDTALVGDYELGESDADTLHWEVDLGLVLSHRKALIENVDDINTDAELNLWLSGGLYYKNFFMEVTPKRNRALTLGYTLHSDENKQINVIASSWFYPFSADDQTQDRSNGPRKLDGIKDRKGTMEMGLELNYRISDFDAQFRILHDALSVHHGSLLSVNISKPIFTSTTMILPSIGLALIDDNAVDYYYGIDADETAPDRPEYHPKSTWAGNIRLYVERPITDRLSIIGSASFLFVGNQIKSSPIVDNPYGYDFNFGVLWVF